MWKIIKSEFIKLKGSTSFKILYMIGILVYFLGTLFAFNLHIGYEITVDTFFEKMFNMDGDLILLKSIINIFLLLGLSIIIDIYISVDKGKWSLLYSKNIRAKYFWSKLVVVLTFTFIFQILMIVADIFALKVIFGEILTNNIIFILLKEFLFNTFFLFIAIIPLLLFFLLLSLNNFRGSLVAGVILFYFIIGLIWNERLFEKYPKTFEFINTKTFFKNYENIINNNNEYYIKVRKPLEYIDQEKENKENKKEKLVDKSMQYNEESIVMYTLSLEDKEVMNILDNYYTQSDLDYSEKFKKYEEDRDKFYEEYHSLDVGRYTSYYYLLSANSKKIFSNFFSFKDTNFNIWLIHIIVLSILGTIYMKKRQIYD